MAEEWAGVVNTTAPKYLKGAEDHTIRNRLVLAMLKKRGRISYNHNGYKLVWQVEALQPPVSAYGDAGQIDFARHNIYRQVEVDVRGYIASDMMTQKEKLMNAGDVALIKRYDRIMPTLTKALRDKFGTELYVDGYAAGNDNRLCGLDSFTGTGTTVAADRIAKPDDTYATRSTAVGQLDTTWTSALTTYPNANIAKDWPDGEGSTGFDYFSPKLVNWSSTNWGTSSTTWEDNCERVVRQTLNWCMTTGGKTGRPEIVVLANTMFTDFQNKMSAKQRIMVPHKEAQDLGFENAMQFDGAAIDTEFGIAANTGYFLNLMEMELCSWSSELFMPHGPEFDIRTLSWLFAMGFFGNFKFNPKAFAKTKNYA